MGVFSVEIYTHVPVYNGCQFALFSYIIVDGFVRVQLRTVFVPKYIPIYVFIYLLGLIQICTPGQNTSGVSLKHMKKSLL